MEEVASSSEAKNTQNSENIPTSERTQKVPRDIWKCQLCNLEECYDYKGCKPPFAKHMSFLEECYIVKDPFSPPNKGEILILGADCCICQKSVCMECSFFYTKRFCKICALENIEHLPLKLQSRTKYLNREDNE